MRQYPKATPYGQPALVGSKHAPAGRVRASGKAVRDDNGLFFPLSTSFFWWWWGFKHDRFRSVQNMAEIAPWADENRAFGEVGGASWEDRVIDPRDADYEDNAKAATDEAFGVHRVRTQLTIFGGGTGADPDMTVGKVINIIRGREEAFSRVEVSNEGNGPDKATRRRLAQRLMAEFPGLLVATTNGSNEDWTPEGFDLDIASMGTDHPERDSGDEDWRQVRQGCELMGFPKVLDDGEPPGFESSIAVLNDPLRLACLRFVGILCGMVCYAHHTGAGVRGGGAADRKLGRAANFWEYDGSSSSRPSLKAAVEAYRKIESLVPADAPNWRGVKGHWADTRLVADSIWSDDSKNIDHGCVRVYGSYAANAYAEMVFGIRRYVSLRQKAGAYNVQAIDVLSGEVVLSRHVADGETFRLEGDPNIYGPAPEQAGSSRAYLVIGTR